MTIKAACHRKPQNKREPVERRKNKASQFQDSLQLRSACSWGSRGSYLFDREKPARLKIHQSMGTRMTWFREPRRNWKSSVTPGRVFILQNRVNTTFQSVTLMICDWRRLCAQIQSGKFSGFLSFVFCSFHILLVPLTRLAAEHKDRCCRYRIKSGFFSKQMDFIYINK